MPPTTRTIIHPIPLGEFARCELCQRTFVGKYEELVDATGATIYKCLCGVCAGSQMVARNSQPFSQALKGASMSTYTVRVEFVIDIEADNEMEAENWGYDWRPEHPQTGASVQPSRSNSEKLSSEGASQK